MDTATKTPQGARATDRVLEALSTLAAFLGRTIDEVKTLDSDFQNRILQAVHETEASLQSQAAQHLEEALTETRLKLEEQFKNNLAEVSAAWDAERARLNAELTGITQTKAQWEAERSRLNGELERLARVQAATQAEAEKAIAAMKAASAAATTAKSGPPVTGEALLPEIERIEGLVKQISALIEDPATELSTVIRKNVERAELESYLKGIRFALNGGSPK
jgi:DNA repair exonuclease SbcCD ATPase subunit